MSEKYTVMDLFCGMGGMSKGFIEAGFKIVPVVDVDKESAVIYREVTGTDMLHNGNISEIDIAYLPSTDIIAGKLITGGFSTSRNKYNKEENDIIYSSIRIIENKKPKIFLFEATTSYLHIEHGKQFAWFKSICIDMGYEILYKNLDGKYFSGLPVVDRKLYIVGIREDIYNDEFNFPQGDFSEYEIDNKEFFEKEVDDWYRRGLKYTDLEVNNIYVKTKGTISKTNSIYTNSIREMLIVDEIGPRRLTHNEMAKCKGLYKFEYNSCKNKSSMYKKISMESSTFIITVLAKYMGEYLNKSENNIYSKDKPICRMKLKNYETKVFKSKANEQIALSNLAPNLNEAQNAFNFNKRISDGNCMIDNVDDIKDTSQQLQEVDEKDNNRKIMVKNEQKKLIIEAEGKKPEIVNKDKLIKKDINIPDIFISYCQKDRIYADCLDLYFKDKNIKLHRDIRDIENWNSIKEFMCSIRNMNYAILIVTDKYLKSFNCMYEVLELIKDKNYFNKIFPVVVDASIYSLDGKIDYIQYWQHQYTEVKNKLKQVDLENLGPLTEDLKRIQSIASSISEFLALVADMNNPDISNINIAVEEKLKKFRILE